MFGGYVGLDLGATAVRAVRLRRSLKGLEIQTAISRQFASAQVESQNQDAALIESLAQLRAEGWGHNERVVVTVPETAVLGRKLDLPFTDLRKLGQVVPYELEDLLPFELEDVVVDYERLTTSAGRTSVLGMAVRKEVFERRLNLLHRAGFQVWRVTVRSLALRAYYDRFISGDDKAVALMHIDLDDGAPTITLCAVHQRCLCGVRTIVGSRQDHAAPAALALAEPELAMLRRTFQVWEQEIARPCSRLYVSGLVSEGQGIPSLLAETSGIQNVHIVGPRSREGRGRKCDPSLVIAVGLAAMGAGRPKGQLDFARNQHSAAALAKTHHRWGTLAVGLCLVLLLAIASLLVHHRTKESRYEQISAAVSTLFRESFHETRAVIDEPRQAKSLLVEAQKRAAFLGVDELTIPQILTELTSHLPKDTPIEIHELGIEGGRLWLEAETDSFESVDRIKGELGRAPHFGDVSVSDARVGPVASRIHCRIQLVLGRR